MKTNHKTIDILDEMLRLAALERSTTLALDDKWIEQMAEFVFSAPLEFLPTDEKSQILLGRLRGELNPLKTFGDLLTSALQERNVDLSALAKTTKLSQETIEQLSKDHLFPNRVPVLLMKRLIEFLGISLEATKRALQRTAALIIENHAPENAPFIPIVARHRTGKKRDIAIDADDFIDSYSAQISLSMYLQRLETLFAKLGDST
jgi:hypothetical protein